MSARLQHHLAKFLEDTQLGARMRWGAQTHRFVRPIRWVLALHGDAPLEMEIMGVHSGSVSYGHRRDCRNAPIAIPSAERYEEVLEQEGKVIVSYQKRQKLIADKYDETFPAMKFKLPEGDERESVLRAVESVEEGLPDETSRLEWHAKHFENQVRNHFATAIEHIYGAECASFFDPSGGEDALDTIFKQHAASVEFPSFIVGNLEASVIADLPILFVMKVLMKDQQFLLGFNAYPDGSGLGPVMRGEEHLLGFSADNTLSEQFLVIVDGKVKLHEHVVRAYERIAAPRLSDIAFFLQNDCQVGLNAHEEELKTLIFHRELGSVYDKSQRLIALSGTLDEMTRGEAQVKIRSALLKEAAPLV